MTMPIQNTLTQSAHVALHSHGSLHGQTQSGTWKGCNVQTRTAGAVNMADMAEEAALSLTRFAGDKNLKRKQDEDKKGKVTQKYADTSPVSALAMPLYEAETWARALAQQRAKDAHSMLDLVKKFFRDPSLQDAALRFAGARMPQNSPDHEELRKAIAILHKESGIGIRAGYNIAPVVNALESAQDLSPQKARDCYRFHVLNYSSYEQTFKNLLQEYDADKLPQTVTFLRKALGADMQALEPSCAPAELHEVAEGLYIIQNLGALYGNAGKLCKDVAKRFATIEPQPRNIMLSLLQCKDNSNLTEPTLRRSMPFLQSTNPSRDAVFVRGVREIARTIPTKLYASEAQRQKVLSALQQNLDKAIDREEVAELANAEAQ